MDYLRSCTKFYSVVAALCVIYEIFSGNALSGTWPMIILFNIYMVAYLLLKDLKSDKEDLND